MAKWLVKADRTIIERAEFEIEAPTEDRAWNVAETMINDGNSEIKWKVDEGQYPNDEVMDVVLIEGERARGRCDIEKDEA